MPVDYRLTDIVFVEVERKSGLRLKEHRVWSLFEADRKLEEIRSIEGSGVESVLFCINYQRGKKPLSYKGVFNYSEKTESISLQRHIENFLKHHAQNPGALKISNEAFERLHGYMRALFEACATEQMFSINRKPVFAGS